MLCLNGGAYQQDTHQENQQVVHVVHGVYEGLLLMLPQLEMKVTTEISALFLCPVSHVLWIRVVGQVIWSMALGLWP